jgi:hypothetical protein
MDSVKLSITCRKALEKKYDMSAMQQINDAIVKWIEADASRGIRNIHVAVDDTSEMKPFKVAPLTGKITPEKVKRVVDALCAKLSPDYVVLIGAGDVVPFFSVANPSKFAGGDSDASVATDNPYASSQAFVKKKRKTYLIPDRAVGRIPDLPRSTDPAWLLEYLAVATSWKAVPAKKYADDLLVCCDTWRKSGKACVEYLSRDAKSLMICPPSGDASQKLRSKHGALLQMIKCHGAPNDSWFYGQKNADFPEVLKSPSIDRRIKKGTVVGAMCCFGASLFDPADPASAHANEVPIPSVYLRQGAIGFLGASGTAWVGDETMMCADRIITSFLKSVLDGASLGRATLESKQGFVRWLKKEGDQLDAAEEKTLLQFVLLGDPSIHPVMASHPAGIMTAAMIGAAPSASIALSRRERRATTFELGALLTAAVPQRRAAKLSAIPSGVRDLARKLTTDVGDGFNFRLSSPRVEQVQTRIAQPELAIAGAAGLVRAGIAVSAAPVVERKNIQYYWTARKNTGPVPDIRLVSIQADTDGNVLRSQTLHSS